MTSKTMQTRKDRLARNKAERNKRIEGKNRIARNAERDKRIERFYYANCSGAPMNVRPEGDEQHHQREYRYSHGRGLHQVVPARSVKFASATSSASFVKA
jgi:hypothetical protein